MHTAEDFSKGWVLLCLTPSLHGRVEGKARQGKFHFEHRGSNSHDISSCPPARGGVQVFSRNPWGCSLPSSSTQAHATVSFLRCLHTRHLQFLQSLAALTALLHAWISGPSSLPLTLPRASLCTGKAPGCSCLASRPPPQAWPSCPWGWLGNEVL